MFKKMRSIPYSYRDFKKKKRPATVQLREKKVQIATSLSTRFPQLHCITFA